MRARRRRPHAHAKDVAHVCARFLDPSAPVALAIATAVGVDHVACRAVACGTHVGCYSAPTAGDRTCVGALRQSSNGLERV